MSEKNPRPDWRQANKKPAAQTPAAGAGKRGWQKQSGGPAGPRKPWSRGSQLALAVLLLSFFVGGVYIVIEWLRPISPACLVLMGSSYDDNLAIPHNAYGWKNLDDLDKLKDEPGLFSESGKLNLLHRCPELKGADIWKKEFDIFSRKIREKTVVLDLALHGASDGKEPYFFIGDDQGYSRLPFTEVLKSLETLTASGKNVVLLIEPALVRANWSAGMLENDFVGKLLELKSKFKPNLFILCASDAFQVSWPSEEWQQTAFGHFVIEGLRGAADLDGNTRVTVAELAKFVKDKVTLWSQVNRGIEQTPVFLGDEAAAADVEIAQVAGSYKEQPGEAPGMNFAVPEGLEAAWRGWQALRSNSPHPAVYSPALWRRYQDLLLRYEQLLRAGDPTKKTGDIAGKLAAMRKKIESEARFEAADTTLSLALPMAEALGIALPLPEAELKRGTQKIWDASKEEQRPEFLKDLVDWAKKQDDVKSAQLRVELYRTFLNFIGQSPLVREADLVAPQNDKGDPVSKTQALLDLFDVKLGPPRPAEVHYLTMLLKDVSRTPSPDLELLRQSLKVRQLAERAALAVPETGDAHPYSEVILPWNRERIVNADALRRPGEDYLFGSSKDDWEKARRFIDQAQAGYRETQKESQNYRQALDARDRSFAELPYFALWVANQRVSSDKAHGERVDDWSKQVVQLSQRAELLQTDLAREKGAASVALRNQAEQVVETLVNLRKSLESEIDSVNQDTHSHAFWFDREAVLSAPPLLADQPGANAVDIRLAMLKYNRVTSGRFFKSSDTPKTFGGKAKDDAETFAKRNLALSMATFKNFWPLDLARVENESVPVVGETMAALVKRWPGDINDTLTQSLKEGDLAAAQTLLRRGDFLARGLPGGFEDKADPMSVSQALRSLRMSDLLMTQARRTMADHWYSEVQDAQPYYETAAQGYLKVARQLVEVKGESRDSNKLRAAACVRLLDAVKTVGLDIEGKASDYWTSEKEFPVRWIVKTPDDPYLFDPKIADDAKIPPPGVAVTWRELEGPGAWKDGVPPGQRKPLELLTHQKRDFADVYQLTKTGADDAALKATYTILLRGQRKTTQIQISQKDPDLVVHDFPKPTKSFIKVRMDPKFTYGAVSIALDISGSMIWKNGFGIDTPEGRKTRLELALVSLKAALKLVPDNTYVSLFAFVTKDREKEPEIVEVLKPSPWSRDRLDVLIGDIERLAGQAWKEDPVRAYGSTPMAYLLAECGRRGFPTAAVNFRGPKVILALSDGDDTSSGILLKAGWPDLTRAVLGKDDQRNYNRRVNDYLLDELGNKDVEIQFVCFLDKEKYKDEARNAEAQFAGVQEFKTPGRFIIQPDPVLLARELEKAIRPRLILEQGSAAPSGYHPEGEFASLPKDEYNWIQVPEGQYTVRVKGSPPRDLKVNHGDMIAIVLKRDPVDPKKIVYEREMFAEMIADTVPPLAEGKAMQDRYRVSVLQNQPAVKANLLTQLIAVEEASKASRLIQQSVPRFTWIESKPKTQAPARMIRWYREFGYPAFTNRVLGYDWPAPAAVVATPEVSVWLTDSPDSEAFARPLERLLKKSKSDTVRLDADQFAVIENVTIEEKDVVPDGLGKVGSRLVPKQCVVVRVEHAKGRPVMIQFHGQHKGEEHHFFHSANKYTALFWDLTNPNQESLSFNVIFLDAMKRETTPATFTVTGRNSNFPAPYPMGN